MSAQSTPRLITDPVQEPEIIQAVRQMCAEVRHWRETTRPNLAMMEAAAERAEKAIARAPDLAAELKQALDAAEIAETHLMASMEAENKLAAENEALRKALYTFAKRPCEYNSKRGAVCSMLPSPIAYCATCTARIAIGNDGLAAITTHPARGEEGAQ